MKIIQIKTNPHAYSSNAYLVLGSWNRISDINTLVDTGIDGFILDDISRQSTGIGKRAVEQIVCTHNHFDHVGGIPAIKNHYHPKILAYQSNTTGDIPLKDGDLIKMGDADFRVIFVPEHSNDSICLYSTEDGVLFTGDTYLNIRTHEGTYGTQFLEFLQYINHLDIRMIYPGHGPAIHENIQNMIRQTLKNVRNSITLKGHYGCQS